MYYYGKSVFGSRTQHNSEPVISAPSNIHFRWFLNGLFTSLSTCSCKVIPQVWPLGTCLWIDCHFYFWCWMSLKSIQHQHTQFFRCTPGCLFHTTANQSSVTSLIIEALNWHLIMTLLCSCPSVVICTFRSFEQESCYYLIILSTSCIFSLPNVSSTMVFLIVIDSIIWWHIKVCCFSTSIFCLAQDAIMSFSKSNHILLKSNKLVLKISRQFSAT